MVNLTTEVRLVLRRFRKNPAFTLPMLLTLAVGIGAITAIFSVVKDILLDPLQYEDDHELVWVGLAAPGMGEGLHQQSLAFNAIFEDESRSFEDVGVWTPARVSVRGSEGPEELSAALVTDGVFRALRVQPIIGRIFQFEDTQTDAPFTIILSHRHWVDRYAEDPGVLGQTVSISGVPWEIIGVLPEGFRFMDQDPAFYRPLRYDKKSLTVSGFSRFGLGRLAPGVTIEQAMSELSQLVFLAPERYPGMATREMLEQVRVRPVLIPLRDDLVGNVGSILWVILGGVAIIFFMAAANSANLLLARAEERERPAAIQAALGSARSRIAVQCLMESLALAILGGVLGLSLAFLSLELLKAIGPGNLPRLSEVGLDPGILFFCLGISLATGLATGLMPFLRLMRTNLNEALREGGRGFSASRKRNRTRNVLVICQVASALVLLAGSGLMVQSFFFLSRRNPGFTHPEEILTFSLNLESRDVPNREDLPLAFEQLARRLENLPGVTSVGLTTSVPMDGRAGLDPLFFEDFPLLEGQAPPLRPFKWVGGDYPQAMGTPIVAGRSISWADIHDRARVVVIAENLAREVFGDPAAAVGRRLSTGLEPGDWREIIGVVGDVRDQGMEHDVSDLVYWPMAMAEYFGAPSTVFRTMVFAIRSPRVGTAEFLNEVREVIWSAHPTQPLGGMVTMDMLQRNSKARTFFTMVILGIASTVALLLGSIGVFGVISYTVSQRTVEFGLRRALGADQGAVVRLVIRKGLVLALTGIGAGVPASLGLTRFMASSLHGVRPVDPFTYSSVAMGLLAVVILASYLPARKAARVDPAVALQAE